MRITNVPALLCLLCLPAVADDPAAPESSPNIQMLGVLQSNFVWSRPYTPERIQPSLGFLQDAGRLRFTEATLSVNGEWARAGFHIEGGSGDLYRISTASDNWQGPNRYISQAYVILKPFSDIPLRIEAGKFYSSIGAESPQNYSEQVFNVSGSLLFWYGGPLYHIGVRALLPINSTWTVGAQLLSGANTITGAHGHQTMAYSVSRTGKRWGWTQGYLGGNPKFDGRGWRHISDTIVTLNVSPRLRAYGEALIATEKRVTPGRDRWYGTAMAWRYVPRNKWALSPRVEWYNDPNGASTGRAQRLTEATITAEYRPRRFLIARMEYRNDWSSVLPRRHAVIGGLTFLLQRGL